MRLKRNLTTHINIIAGVAMTFATMLFTLAAPEIALAAGTHLDTTFGGTGKTNFGFGDNSFEDANAVAIQPDGKIVVVGRTNATGGWDMAVARLKTDGTPENTFDGDGLLTIDFGGNVDTAYAVSIQTDGKIVIGGETLPLGGSADFAVARISSLGVLDSTFSGDGKATYDFTGANDAAYGLAVQPDGKILLTGIAGMGSSDWGIVRLTDLGVPDSSFGNSGRVTTDFNQLNDIAKGIVILPDGKIVIAGTAINASGGLDFALARYTSGGIPDAPFQNGGKLLIDINGGSTDEVRAFKVTSDGKLVIGGESSSQNGWPRLALVRCSIDGILDNNFDGDGKAIASFNSEGNNLMGGLAVSTSGEIAVAARIDSRAFNSGFNVIRFRSDGKLDTQFGAGGRVNTVFGLSERWSHDVAFQTDGKIVAVGSVRGYSDFGVARYNSRGIAVTSDFDGDGRADIGVYRPSEGMWYLQNSVTGVKSYVRFGLNGDEPVPGDYDGDGKTDIAVYRRSNGSWYVQQSSDGQLKVTPFGLSSDMPLPGDYDGDGKTDIAVYRLTSGYWYMLGSSRGLEIIKYGNDVSFPVPGDYDGDGATDIAVFRSSDKTWWMRGSQLGDNTIQFGGNGDLPMPADYDGDGVTDIAVYRFDGNWWVQRSQSASVSASHWGLGSDLTAPADFDGDGRVDLAVFRSSIGVWYITRADGTWRILEWGIEGDIPLAGLTLRALA
jgi:uncharacterized delta-60 repeat protein